MHWTEEHDNELIALRDLGLTQKEIADELVGRFDEKFTRDSVKNRMSRIGSRETFELSEENRFLRSQNKQVGFLESIANSVREAGDKALPVTPLEIPHIKDHPDTQALLVMSDTHFGFNSKEVAKKINKLVTTISRITDIHRNGENIDTLNIFMLGDIVDGYDIYPGQSAYLDHQIIGQVFRIGVPTVGSAFLTLAKEFKKINIHCIYGNHSRLNKHSPEEENWDIAFYETLKHMLAPQTNITVNIYSEKVKIVKIGRIKFCLTHMDGIRATSDSPLPAIIRKGYKWYATYGGFNYLIGGHFHHCSFVRASQFGVYLNGCMKEGDTYPEYKLGVVTPPEQWYMGVSSKRVTWKYAIDLS